MKKLFILIGILFLITGGVFISCTDCESFGGVDCSIPEYCKSNEACKTSSLHDAVCVNGECRSNPCLNSFCGTGTCTIGDNPETQEREEKHYCECGENSLPYDYFEDGRGFICTPKCETHSDCSEAYVNLGHQLAGACIKGQCHERNLCEVSEDCPEDNICGYGQCGPKPIEE